MNEPVTLLDRLEEAQVLLDESSHWVDETIPCFMELQTILGGLLIKVIPSTKEIISFKWRE